MDGLLALTPALRNKALKMTAHIAINGFGRIGRTVLRTLLLSGRTDLQVVAINDPADTATLAHLFEYDSLHGRFPGTVDCDGTSLTVNGRPIAVTNISDSDTLDWSGVDLVVESSGHFTRKSDALRHIDRGAGKVLISAPAKDDVKTIIYGVNHRDISAQDRVISNASCTTNCLVPMVKVLDDAFGVVRGMMTTVHCYTRSQSTHDGPHEDLYRARAAALSMVPTTSGAAIAMGQVLPHLAGRITGQAIRVPTPNVSCIDLTVEVATGTTPQEINALFTDAVAGEMQGILGTTDKKLVSADFRNAPESGVMALDQTRVQSHTLVRVLAWYDNEWGFAHRMADTASVMASA